MRVEVRLFATLADFLPPDLRGNSSLDVPDGSRVSDVMARLGISDAIPRMALVNGEDAPADRALAEGDVLDVFPPLAGG
ncbi:MAG: MoaD/ThiS family protein [Candidatus Rokuibacteriota bacterium]